MERIRQIAASVIFAVTIFVSASLLFVVQPMVGKMILPHLGGSSSVWTTCMLFFQTMLVAGYVYAHGLAQRLAPRTQVLLHAALLLTAAALSLPFKLPSSLISTQGSPSISLLGALLVGIGLPLFAVSSTAPLYQHWFGFTEHRDADDPYYLYAASNVGSLLALVGYPFVIERTFDLDTQASLWAVGFGLLAVLTAGCGWYVFDSDVEHASSRDTTEASVSWTRRAWWLVVTFIPSSLMLGVTEYVTTDVASVPLLWVFPLALYLLSFVVVFSRFQLYTSILRRLIPFATLGVLSATYLEYFTMPVEVVVHLWLFFLFALYFHGRLAEDRPHTRHLTEFYIWMSVGGALGGLFNALVAPALFEMFIEYELVLAAGLAVTPPLLRPGETDSTFVKGAVGSALVGALALYLWSTGLLAYEPGVMIGVFVAVATIVGTGLRIPVAQNAGLALLVAFGLGVVKSNTSAIDYARSFYSYYSVYEDVVADHQVRVLSSGTTQHGLQVTDGKLSTTPIGYHHPKGPIGEVFRAKPTDRVAVAGLGAGAMAAYGDGDTHLTFYEIDPAVEEIAREHFTYLEQCGDHCTVRLGDARQLLEQTEPRSFDVIVMDAYNSDSVPTHLLTREAMKLYLSRLKKGGVVLFHVSNRYLNVESVVGALAEDLDLPARTRSFRPKLDDEGSLAYPSVYVAVARKSEALAPLSEEGYWREPKKADVVWTDRFTNIVSIVRWQY